jgi:hypothetical protein
MSMLHAAVTAGPSGPSVVLAGKPTSPPPQN